ncbi:MAG TPA: SpoIIE family protein phosphatase [Bacillota bacterium]|nr:SpoIIE family protein phosphatase [Bacillota bacterium]
MKTNGSYVDVAVYQKAKGQNCLCGDSYFYQESEEGFICALADGLGSGQYAKESADIVIDVIKQNTNASVKDLVKQCNQQLYGKRGVVLGILKFDFIAEKYTFSSIGNISILTIAHEQKKKRNIPNAGYLAGYHRSFKVEQQRLEPGMRFILFSDGVTDEDLSESFYVHRDTDLIVEHFAEICGDDRDDDTTLIAIKYR